MLRRMFKRSVPAAQPMGTRPSSPAMPDALNARRTLIQVARGRQPADLVQLNGKVINVFSHEVYEADVAVY